MTQDAAAELLAHGLGGSTDLPMPATVVLVGAAWVLTFTFALVALAWKRPKFDPRNPGRPLPAAVTAVIDARATRGLAAGAALVLTGWVLLAGLFGPQTPTNVLPGMFYVLLWVGVAVLSLVAGPLWRAISPLRSVYRLLMWTLPGPVTRPRWSYPATSGYRPAAFGLFAFVWMELASPDPAAMPWVKTWLVLYTVLMIGGAGAFGPVWFARADPFEVYSMTVSRLSAFRRDPDTGAIVVGNPLDHLPSLPVRPGVVAVLSVLFGSTVFDSYAASPSWRNFADRFAGAAHGVPPQVSSSVLRSIGLAVFIAVVALTFTAAARATGGLDSDRRRALPGEMAHSLIPIVVGYIFAHYLSFLVERGQQTVFAMGDPLGRGWNVLGLAHLQVDYLLSRHPAVLASIKVLAVIIGHVVAVISAHDRALRLLPTGHQLTGQLAMMLVMVGYTFTGLYLLFGA
jgi:hypothetical protein